MLPAVPVPGPIGPTTPPGGPLAVVGRVRRITARGRWLLGGVLGLCLWLGREAGAAPPHFALELDVHGLRADEVAPARAFLAQVEASLPPRLRAELSFPLRVSFAALDGETGVEPPRCPPGGKDAPGEPDAPPPRHRHRLGGVDAAPWGPPSRVRLHRGFLPALVAGPGWPGEPVSPCGHRTLHRLAWATLLHELVHVLDGQLGLSHDVTFRALSALPLRGPLTRSRNVLALRSPDGAEFVSAEESLAVNAEFFLLDPEYKCRRPTLYRFFEDRLRYRPFPGYACRVPVEVPLGDEALRLDPRRIYQVHLLFAARGDELVSRWGHAMFRLVVCAPERETVDARCLQDLSHHVVLTFAANLAGELSISTYKGLFGGYPSQLFVKRFPDVLIEYTELELRDLESLPLLLSDDEKQQFVLRALELYWAYSGRYFFLSNNCATESLGLLRAALRGRALDGVRVISPRGLRTALVARGLAEPVEADADAQARAEAAGRYFPALQRVYAPAFLAVRDVLPPGAPATLERYIRKTTAAERRAWFLAAPVPPGAPRAQLAAQFLSLENLIWLRRYKALERRLPYLLRGIRDGAARLQAVHRRLLGQFGALPWLRLSRGYGIPLEEGRAVPAAAAPLDAGELEALTREAVAALRERYPEEFAAIEALRDNRDRLQRVIVEAAQPESAAPRGP